MLTTRASGRRSDVAWYRREYAAVPAEEKLLDSASYSSAILPGPLAASLFTEPPWTRTLPFGRRTPPTWIRPVTMSGPLPQEGLATDRSITSVVFFAGFGPPPATKTLGVYDGGS